MRNHFQALIRAAAIVELVAIVHMAASPIATAAPAEVSKLDKLQGFRDVTFGAAPSPDLVLAETDGSLKFFHRPDDNLKIGKATLTEIIYGFYKGQFFIAILKTKGKKNGRALLDVFDDEYGTPSQPNASLQRYSWSGKVNSASFSEDSANGEVKAAILNNAIEAQQDADATGGQ